jgi:hypothetical protein
MTVAAQASATVPARENIARTKRGERHAHGDVKGTAAGSHTTASALPAVILVSGALGYRKFMEELAKLLAERCTVINYDRRGRGDSTEVKPFALERVEAAKSTVVVLHGTCALLKTRPSDGSLLVLVEP